MTTIKAKDKRLQRAMDIVESSLRFTLDENEDNLLMFSTREHGNVMEETHSPIDFERAYRMAKTLREEGFHASVETVDEWVLLHIHAEKPN